MSVVVHLAVMTSAYGNVCFDAKVFYFGLSLLVVLLKKPAALSSGPAH
jgi:MFS transporter, DHA2 family, multidrug resistance protein